MAKFKHSVCIRIGASHDDVTVHRTQPGMSAYLTKEDREADAHNYGPLYFDRAALSKQRHEGTPAERMDAKASLYGLRKGVIDAFVAIQEQKHKRAVRRDRKYARAA